MYERTNLRIATETRPARNTLGGGGGGGDRDVMQEFTGPFVLAEGDCFGAVDGRAAGSGDEGVD
jgi:hypothetical protein